MVIGIDASRGNDPQRTGTEWYSFHLINALKSIIPNTDTVILYSKTPLRADWSELPANWKVKVLGWKPGLLWTQLRLSWEMLWHAPDVLFVPAHTIPFKHPKTVLVAHDIGFEKADQLYGKTVIGQERLFGRCLKFFVRLLTFGRYGTSELDYHRWAMRFGVKHASKIITISEFSKRELLSTYPLASKKVQVIWHALPDITPQSTLAKTPQQAPVLLYIGRIEVKKNLSVLIQAMAEIPQAHRPQLVCIGKEGLGAEHIKQQVKDSHLEKCVQFTGWLSETEVEIWRSKTTAMILPSAYEGFGLPLLEAWRAHLPMIASNIPALKEVGDSAVEFFEVNSATDCARAIQKVVGYKNEQQKLVQKGKNRLSLFSLERMARATYQVIQECGTL